MSKAILEALKQRFPERIRETYTFRGDDVAVIDPAATLEIHNFLKYDPALDMKLLLSVTAVDYLGQTPRFEVVTNLTSLTHHHRLRLRTRVPEERPELPSLAGLFRTANWWERYVYDLYGIRFTGHPDLRRLYLPQEWVGHPLRKDYPVKGRQPIVPERGIRDLIRGPGPNPRTAPLPVLKD
jgi:NADH-quinone oxidoreductase subunit C